MFISTLKTPRTLPQKSRTARNFGSTAGWQARGSSLWVQHCLMASKIHAEAIKKRLSNDQYAASYENVRVCRTCMSSEQQQQQKQSKQQQAAGVACVAQKCGGFKNTKINDTETEENARKFTINQPTPISHQSTDRRITAQNACPSPIDHPKTNSYGIAYRQLGQCTGDPCYLDNRGTKHLCS